MKIQALLHSGGSERSLSAALYAAGLMKGHPGLELISFADIPRGPLGLTVDEEAAGTKVLLPTRSLGRPKRFSTSGR